MFCARALRLRAPLLEPSVHTLAAGPERSNDIVYKLTNASPLSSACIHKSEDRVPPSGHRGPAQGFRVSECERSALATRESGSWGGERLQSLPLFASALGFSGGRSVKRSSGRSPNTSAMRRKAR